MQRLATTVAIAAWTGFLAVFAVELLADSASPDFLAAVARVSWPPAVAAEFDRMGDLLSVLSPPVELALAAICLATAGLFAKALVLLHSPKNHQPERAERFAAASLAIVSALAVAAQASALPLLPIDLDGHLVWIAIALSVLAVLFDRLVAIETHDEEDEHFQAGMSAIAESMARQTRLYVRPDMRQGDR